MIRFSITLAACIALATPAWAGDLPQYLPIPDWVAPSPPAGPGDATSLLQIIDQQSRIADGGIWSYHELATRALSADALAHIGTINLLWQPFHGDIIVHRVDIIREGQRIDLLKAGQKFTVIRREQNLEQLQIDGQLTATLQVEGLRVGDVLDYAYSVTSKDPVLKGQVQVAALTMSNPLKIGFARARFLWPAGSPIKWRAYPVGMSSTESEKDGWHDLSFVLPAPKQPELPVDAPQRFHRLPLVEATSFASWTDVSKIVAPLYASQGLIAAGSPLAEEIKRIERSTPDPKKRIAAALALVQTRVRYFANAMNAGNYTPQPPAETWKVGYGDCKAKTLLLLAILDALGIEAEPVLANIGQGDYVHERLPSLSAFNHILVHSKNGTSDLWLDGTGRGTRIEDLQDPPPFRWVLPARKAGSELTELPFQAPARPVRTISVTIDQSAGISLPATYEATITLRGSIADSLRVAVAQLDQEHLLKLAVVSLGGAAGPKPLAVTQKYTFDAETGTATINVSGITPSIWTREGHSYRFRPPSAISGVKLNTDRARAAWTSIPVSTGIPNSTFTTTTVKLPDGGRQVTIEGDEASKLDAAARTLVRRSALTDGVLTIQDEETASGAELAPADLPSARAKIIAAQSRLVRLATTDDYPPPHVQVAEATRDHKLDRLAAAFTALIADKPDDPSRYLARATFYEATYQWKEATADFNKAIALDGSAANLSRRANLFERLGEKAKATDDYNAILTLDPSSKHAMARLGLLNVDAGQKAAALGRITPYLDNAGEDKPEWLGVEAEVLARANDAVGALAAIDEAVRIKPGKASFLGQRCWTKATLDVQLDSALPDCNRAIELSSGNTAPLEIRALVYFRLHRFSEALADINAALDVHPSAPEALFIRGVAERANGDGTRADADLANAKRIAPNIIQEYARWNIQS